ncbi:MAG TPA: ATP-binding protein, partial [Pseudoxanthomonas sp.]|nr:ATP-binding protein [Pseudoxanthomonas sp.]
MAFRSKRWRGYMLAVSLTALAVWARFHVGDALQGSPFLVSLAAVLLTVFLGGLGPGLLAALLSGLLCQYFFIPPADALRLEWPDGWVAMAFYWSTAALIIALVHGMFSAYEGQLHSDAKLRELNEALEHRVVERTSALEAEARRRSEAQGQVRQLQKMESLGQLTGGIAHDFNNMLAIIIGSLDMAKRRLTGNEHPKLAANLENAAQGAQRAAVLTARLLAFSRQQPLVPLALDANKLVSGMSEMLRRTIGEQVRVETVLAGGLWQAFADAAQLEHALVNLAVNARDAMPTGGKLTVETANADLDDRYALAHEEVEAGQYVLICVSDTGVGMSPDVIERAFDPFYTTKGVGKGTGLGLSQVYGFVKQSGGHVKIYSEIGQGTTVKVYLPRHHAQPMADDASRERFETP